MIPDGSAFLLALVSILLLDLDILLSILTSSLSRIIARNHGASTHPCLALPLSDSCLLALDVSNMKSLLLVDQVVSSDISNTKFLQLMDQGAYCVFPSFYYSFLHFSNADFKCSVKLPSQGIQSFTLVSVMNHLMCCSQIFLCIISRIPSFV